MQRFARTVELRRWRLPRSDYERRALIAKITGYVHSAVTAVVTAVVIAIVYLDSHAGRLGKPRVRDTNRPSSFVPPPLPRFSALRNPPIAFDRTIVFQFAARSCVVRKGGNFNAWNSRPWPSRVTARGFYEEEAAILEERKRSPSRRLADAFRFYRSLSVRRSNRRVIAEGNSSSCRTNEVLSGASFKVAATWSKRSVPPRLVEGRRTRPTSEGSLSFTSFTEEERRIRRWGFCSRTFASRSSRIA